MPAHHPHNAVRYLLVDRQSDGQRLDNFLTRELKGLPRSAVYRIIRRGEVRVNKGRARPTTRLNDGDSVRIPPLGHLKPTGGSATPTDFSPSVIFEDEHLLAIDKPAGLAVHSGTGVMNGAIERLRASRPQNPYLELVHRLDRDTSGCLLIAKSRPALVRLHEQLRDYAASDVIEKTYVTLLLGQLRKIRKVTAELDDDGVSRVAVSTFMPDRSNADFTLAEVRLHTGRKHQVRRHAQIIGFPVAGDERYGDYRENRRLRKIGLRRIFLHASRIRVKHPVTQRPLDLRAALPTELKLTLAELSMPSGSRQEPDPGNPGR